MIKAIIVDLDDTLILTEELAFHLENEVLRQMGRPPMSRIVHQTTWGQVLWEAITQRSPGVDAGEFRRLFGPVMSDYALTGKIDVITEANYEALQTLKAMRKQVMILTSRAHEELAHLLTPDHRLADHVLQFYYHDTMQFHKPDPRAFSEVLNDHGLVPEEAVYVGDSPSDAAASNGAGLRFVANLEGGLRTETDFANYQTAAFINSFPELVGVVEALDESQA